MTAQRDDEGGRKINEKREDGSKERWRGVERESRCRRGRMI